MSAATNGLELGVSQKSLDFNVSSTIELTTRGTNGAKEKGDNEEEFTKTHPTSDFDALLHVVKSSLGTGVLATADGFKNAGMLIGIIGTVVIGTLCAHCSYIMVKSSQDMCQKLNKPFLGYTETIVSAFEHCAGKRFSKYSRFVKTSVDGIMFFTYYGVNTVYILLVAASLQEIIESNVSIEWDIRWYVLMCAVPIFLVGMVRNMKYLVPFSALANVLIFVGLCLTLYITIKNLPPFDSRPLVAPITRLPLFFSTVLFGMEGIGTILPIENSMKNPKHFLGCPGVLTIGMSIVITLFVLVGVFGYWQYGEDAKGSVTLNLPDDALAQSVKGLVALAILFTYGLQLTASIDVVWKRMERKYTKATEKKPYYITRGLMILGTVIIAIIVPNLAPVISLIGALGFSMCGFFYPALTETLICMDRGFGPFKWILVKNICFAIITVVAAVSGCATSISDIIETYS